MSMRGWFSQKAGLGASRSLTALDEPQALQEALESAAKIINDEIDEAEAELSKGTSPFHKLGSSTALFLRAVLGFEKQVMEAASAQLADAEESASEHHRRAIRDPSTAHQSSIYPPGSEYALCHAESQLMSAVVGVLNESLTESLRGFYKLRKAFNTLYEISEAERKYLAAHKANIDSKSNSTTTSSSNLKEDHSSGLNTPLQSSGVLTPVDGDLEFTDAEEDSKEIKTPLTYQGHLEHPGFDEPSMQSSFASLTVSDPPDDEEEIDFRTITSDPIDLFIHSGTNLCYGLLQLLLSLIPPAFSKLLSIFSFRGDRQTGLKMMWSATKFKHNVNGAFAALITLMFHSGAVAFCDILMKDALPQARLKHLLREMREVYPKSKLWLLEESRMLAGDRQLEKAIDVLADDTKSPLKQIEALRMFETALDCMYLHRYEQCATSFLRCVELNSWSHALYYYIAGCCYVELYRDYKDSDPKKAAEYAKLADKYLHIVPSQAGKKRFMARQLPFDVFVLRKIAKWDHRAKAKGCQFVDGVGVSPIEEMSYFWSGFLKKNSQQLQASLDRLTKFGDETLNPNWKQEPIDEKAMLALLQATCLRFLGRTEEAKTTLTENVFTYDLAKIKACDSAETWPLPVGHYEMAACLWDEAGGEDGDKAILKKCSEEIAKVEKWESFDLEARVGMKVTTARGTLKRCGITAL